MLYRQIIGTAMGSKPAPDYANIFMSTIDEEVLKIAKENNITVKFYKRYLDEAIQFKAPHRLEFQVSNNMPQT